MFKLFKDIDRDDEVLEGADGQGLENRLDFDDTYDDYDDDDYADQEDVPDWDTYADWDDIPDWREESGWNDVYGYGVDPSDIIEFRD
ncbi:MAG: hypothetical protein J5985_08170 [Kiritimatiellae bacterium]|nr:hypothetical protein [Kiritimatiellia bacterium]